MWYGSLVAVRCLLTLPKAKEVNTINPSEQLYPDIIRQKTVIITSRNSPKPFSLQQCPPLVGRKRPVRAFKSPDSSVCKATSFVRILPHFLCQLPKITVFSTLLHSVTVAALFRFHPQFGYKPSWESISSVHHFLYAYGNVLKLLYCVRLFRGNPLKPIVIIGFQPHDRQFVMFTQHVKNWTNRLLAPRLSRAIFLPVTIREEKKSPNSQTSIGIDMQIARVHLLSLNLWDGIIPGDFLRIVFKNEVRHSTNINHTSN